MEKYLFEIIAFVGVLILGVAVYTCDPFAGKCFGQVTHEAVSIRSIPPIEFANAIKTGEYKLIDIRTVEEYYEGHLAGAAQNDYYQSVLFDNYLDGLDKNEKYLIYCRSGNRTGEALKIMEEKGFKNVADLDGGIASWGQFGLPVER